MGSTYKIIAKILALSLREVLPSVISLNQWAFLTGSSILDGVLCVDEIIDSWIRENLLGLIC